jgi:acyl dehydratase
MPLDHRRLLTSPPAEIPFRYGKRETMLHALGIGLGMDALDNEQLKFVYDKDLKAFPTMSAALGWVDLTRDPRFYDPAWGLDANRIVVGEMIITAHRPLPVEGSGIARMFFAKAVDKGPGKAALLCTRKEVTDGSGTLLGTLDTWLFVRGSGGFGGPSEGGPVPVRIPERAADMTVTLPTPENLALVYRLVYGDHNALHADPVHAARVGFPRPILHGAASFSIGVHAVLKGALGYDAERYRSGRARFVQPVFPGDTLATEIWVDGGEIRFRTRAVEREVLVVDSGLVETA